MIRKIGLIILVFSLMACSKSNDSKPLKEKPINPNVIYGNDDRLDLFQITDPDWYEIAQSTMAIIDKKKLSKNGDHYQISHTEIGYTYNLCQEEPFREQPTSAFCSGFLIGPDIVATAGHCIRNEFNCEKARFVFNFSYHTQGHDPTVVSKDDVFECKDIIHSQTDALTGLDFALIRLKNKVTQYAPLSLQLDDLIADDQPLSVIGHPSGLPTKFADSANVRTNSEEFYFVANLDTYGGNSGSAVFNSDTKKVEGILVRGESDYKYDNVAECRRSNKCEDGDCRGEDVVRISAILEYIEPSDLEPLPLKPPATLLTPPIVY